MKGEEKLWAILNEKLENLRATNRLPQAIRVAERRHSPRALRN
jgi:hypothetical protein